jgi:hypothetical protein
MGFELVAQLRSRGRSFWVIHSLGWPLTGKGTADDVGLADGAEVGVPVLVGVGVAVRVADFVDQGVRVGVGVLKGDGGGESAGLGVGVGVRDDDFGGDAEDEGWVADPIPIAIELL